MACLDEIVTLGICPDEAESLSGFKLIDAPGISIKNLAGIATETYTSGVEMAMAKKSLAITQLKNDFIGALQTNRVVTTQSKPVYDSAIFDTNTSMGTYNGERGTVLHLAGNYTDILRKTYIKSIQCYPLVSGYGQIKITDGFNEYTYDVEFIANQVNTFTSEQLDGFPFLIQSNKATVLIDNTTISFCSSRMKCGKGCNGTIPNPCGWTDGWDGAKHVKSEGYGIVLNFYCECDYTKVLCDLSNTFTGELIWLKWQIAIFKEAALSNRFSNWVIYGKEDIEKSVIPDLTNAYNAKWNELMAGLFSILKTYNGECLDCKGIRRRANI